VYDPSADALLPAVVYYAVGRIEYVVRYEYNELAAHAVESGHSGPWDPTVNAAKSKETL